MSSRNNGRLQETGRRAGRWLYYHYMTVAADGMEKVLSREKGVERGASSVRSRCAAQGGSSICPDGIFSSSRLRLSFLPSRFSSFRCLLFSVLLFSPFPTSPLALSLQSSPLSSSPVISPLFPRFRPASPLPSGRLAPSCCNHLRV